MELYVMMSGLRFRVGITNQSDHGISSFRYLS
jgi:hypothetical protein